MGEVSSLSPRNHHIVAECGREKNEPYASTLGNFKANAGDIFIYGSIRRQFFILYFSKDGDLEPDATCRDQRRTIPYETSFISLTG